MEVLLGEAIFMITSSADVVQLPLEIVHLNVTLVPTVKPVTVVVGEAAEVIVQVPVTMLHVPAPTVAVLAANWVVVTLQRF